ncbi:MaoC family dehydratase [Marinobacter sp. SS21]|uniref:MaoC family dehydratase n=1 Tax=Marinobacter sp. SS21 TaxID=2979460 RepID=UPI00232F866A|nr:MaoC family dehydratase [Marinobacter sp. SS21]MDC0661195.1 MaoC family dehydratase [Marinobacter sp. SS21]
MLTIPFDSLTDYLGITLGHSAWTQISQDRVQAFADATGDQQWIHVDVARARRESPWHSPIAHGFLTLSLLPLLNQQVFRVAGTTASINYGLDRVRFPTAVMVGAEIRSKVELLAIRPQGEDRTRASYRSTLEVRDQDRPACVAEHLVLYTRRSR